MFKKVETEFIKILKDNIVSIHLYGSLAMGDLIHTITIREGSPADAYGIASVQVRGWHATYKGNVPDEF